MAGRCLGCVHGWATVVRRPAVAFMLVTAAAQHFECTDDEERTHFVDERTARYLSDARFDELDWETAGLIARAVHELPDEFPEQLATMMGLLEGVGEALAAWTLERVQACRSARR